MSCRQRKHKAVLLYQGAVAHVYKVYQFQLDSLTARQEKFLFCGTYEQAVYFAKGLGTAGWQVITARCDMAGDVAKLGWTMDLKGGPYATQRVSVLENCSLKPMRVRQGYILLEVTTKKGDQRLQELLGVQPKRYRKLFSEGEFREVTEKEAREIKLARVYGVKESVWTEDTIPCAEYA